MSSNSKAKKRLDTEAFWVSLIISTIMTLDRPLFSDDHVPYWAYGLKWVVFFGLFYFGFTTIGHKNAQKHRKPLLTFASVMAILIITVVYFLYLAA